MLRTQNIICNVSLTYYGISVAYYSTLIQSYDCNVLAASLASIGYSSSAFSVVLVGRFFPLGLLRSTVIMAFVS